MPDTDAELAVLRRLAVAVLRDAPVMVAQFAAEWADLSQWKTLGGKGEMLMLVNDVDVSSDVASSDVAVKESVRTTESIGIVGTKDRRKARRATPERRTVARTWFSPYYHAYQESYGEKPTAATIKLSVRMLTGLEKEFSPAEVLRRFTNYLKVTPSRFYSVARFAERFVAFKDATPAQGRGAVPEAMHGESSDDYVARLIRLGY